MGAITSGKFALVILGPQGSGKGTQAQILAGKLGLEKFEMGAQLRLAKEKDDDFGRQVGLIINRGGYVTDWMVEKVFRNYFENNNHDRIIFDGVPRTLEQSDIFDQILKDQGLSDPWIINVNLSTEGSLKRLLTRGREDDTNKIIKNRLKNHQELTGPVIEKYRKLGRIIDIDGEPPIEKVTKSIFEALVQKGIRVN